MAKPLNFSGGHPK